MPLLSALSRHLPSGLKSACLEALHPCRERFQCPVCHYSGPFLPFRGEKPRQDVVCPGCGSLERHRLIWLVLAVLNKEGDFKRMRALHFAPERCLQKRLRLLFANYETADLSGKHADYKADMCALEFPDASFDLVLASHVLHHIRDEERALRELRRILQPGGVAVIPVPIFSGRTITYPQPVETQIRAPGLDYFERCAAVFSSIRLFASEDFPGTYQTWIREDRSTWPPLLSQRPRSAGERHSEYVPLCFR